MAANLSAGSVACDLRRNSVVVALALALVLLGCDGCGTIRQAEFTSGVSAAGPLGCGQGATLFHKELPLGQRAEGLMPDADWGEGESRTRNLEIFVERWACVKSRIQPTLTVQ